jgi:hypothetical protein
VSFLREDASGLRFTAKEYLAYTCVKYSTASC